MMLGCWFSTTIKLFWAMEKIIIKNAYQNNLKNIDVEIPLNDFTCVSGCSGCGKSSLVFDTVFAESQRAFLEGMSGNLYGQKFLEKPKVGSIQNLRPALNISQNYYNVNPRSNVGSITEVSLYLRALFAIALSTSDKTYSEKNFSSYCIESCCSECSGTGVEYVISEALVVPDPSKKLIDGAILPFKGSIYSFEHKSLLALCEYFGINPEKTFYELLETEKKALLYTKEKLKFHLRFKVNGSFRQQTVFLQGAIAKLSEKLEAAKQNSNFSNISKYVDRVKCHVCDGLKLKSEILQLKVCDKNISEVEELALNELIPWLDLVNKTYKKTPMHIEINQIILQIKNKIEWIINLKLDYLSLSRSVVTLSGGERQRIRLSTLFNCSLKDLIYIFDEPCKGLHYQDISRIIEATKQIVKNGNTVIAIEHNKQYLSSANNLIILGPEGGPKGGYILYSGINNISRKIELVYKKKRIFNDYIEFNNINFRNIRNQSVKIPVGGITCITGVSGSGKSSLANVIYNCLYLETNYMCENYRLNSKIKKVLNVDQDPIGKTPRSTIVSYLGIYDDIRNIFSNTSDAKKIKLTPASFSMNLPGGRCECCLGTGVQKIELNYLPSTFVRCPECDGKRFHPDVLRVKYKNRNIQEILDTQIFNIIDLFKDCDRVYSYLNCIIEIGLGYLTLGQMSMNLSGGEAQRIKLAKALGDLSNGRNLYLLDEPTSGLNELDIEKFIGILLRLQSNGNTIVIIEHNPEFIAKVSDYVIDFGLKSGDKGGVVAEQGETEFVFNSDKSSWYFLPKD